MMNHLKKKEEKLIGVQSTYKFDPILALFLHSEIFAQIESKTTETAAVENSK